MLSVYTCHAHDCDHRDAIKATFAVISIRALRGVRRSIS